jgi:hypothetical protein
VRMRAEYPPQSGRPGAWPRGGSSPQAGRSFEPIFSVLGAAAGSNFSDLVAPANDVLQGVYKSSLGVALNLSSSMEFWVYQNWRASGHKAVVHRASCAFCSAGRGLAGGTRSDNGRWVGPHPSEEVAKAAAANTGGEVKLHRCI